MQPWRFLSAGLVMALLCSTHPHSQTPAPGGAFTDARVEHAGIVIADVDRAATHYADLFGVTPPTPAAFKGVAYPADFGGDRDAHPRYAMLALSGASLELLQPIGGDSPWRQHLDRLGESLHHICFAVKDVPTAVAHLRALGGLVEFGGDPNIPYAYVNFRDTLGFTIELTRLRVADAPANATQATLGQSPIRHIGMVVPDADAAGALFSRILGVPVPAARPPSTIVFPPDFQGDRNARNRNITFPMNVNIEFAQPVGGKSMWRDEVDARGASMHHLGISVGPSMATWVDYLALRQGRVVTGPGTGYAFVDLRPDYGFTIELNGK